MGAAAAAAALKTATNACKARLEKLSLVHTFTLEMKLVIINHHHQLLRLLLLLIINKTINRLLISTPNFLLAVAFPSLFSIHPHQRCFFVANFSSLSNFSHSSITQKRKIGNFSWSFWESWQPKKGRFITPPRIIIIKNRQSGGRKWWWWAGDEEKRERESTGINHKSHQLICNSNNSNNNSIFAAVAADAP